MEKITNSEIKLIDLPQLMNDKIIEFFLSFGIAQDDIINESQNRWTACMMYLYNNLFKHCKHLYIQGKPHKDDIYSYINYYSISFNYTVLDFICDLYINFSHVYNKWINIYNFSKLLNINIECIYKWESIDKLNPLKAQIYQKLTIADENSLANFLITNKSGQVGILAILNHKFNYNMPSVRVQSPQVIAQSVEELPQIGVSPSNCTKPIIDDIVQKVPQSQ